MHVKCCRIACGARVGRCYFAFGKVLQSSVCDKSESCDWKTHTFAMEVSCKIPFGKHSGEGSLKFSIQQRASERGRPEALRTESRGACSGRPLIAHNVSVMFARC